MKTVICARDFSTSAGGAPRVPGGFRSGLRGRIRETFTGTAAVCLAALVVLFSGVPEGANGAVIMETNGTVTSIGVPPAPAPGGEGEAGSSAPPGEAGDATGGSPLPWGIVPEVHIPWWPPRYSGNGWQRPPQDGWQRPPQGGGPRPPQDGWQRPPRPPQGDWQRPPQGGGPRPPQDGWQRPPQGDGGGYRPPQGWNPRPGGVPKPPVWRPGGPDGAGQGAQGYGPGRPGSGTPPQLVRPPLGSAHIPGGGPGGSSVLLPPGR